MSSDELEKLKCLRGKFNLEDESERDQFRWQLDSLISNWKGELPDLRAIFSLKEIEHLLTDAAKYSDDDDRNDEGERFIDFVIQTGYKDELQLDEDGEPLTRRTTPLHRVAQLDREDECEFSLAHRTRIIAKLFRIYNRFDVNYSTRFDHSHYHVAGVYGCVDVIEKFLELGQKPDYRTTLVDPLLNLVLARRRWDVAELLLRRGADPNTTDREDRTVLHAICQRHELPRDYEFAKTLFEICDEKGRAVQVDARDRLGKTALHLALLERHWQLAELLLRRGADPNVADARGSAPLHAIIHKRQRNDCLIKFLFHVCDVLKRRVEVDTVDGSSRRTPLHLALEYHDAELFALLLRRGADPNAASADGVTPLRFCLRAKNVGWAKILFKTYEEMGQPAPINVRDSEGWTPLEWAVASVLPHAVDLLLDAGADLSSFVFPTESRFRGHFLSENNRSLKLGITTGALAIADILEKGGYELQRSDALTIMKFFAQRRLYEKSEGLDDDQPWFTDKKFVKRAKKTMINPSLSLYDLVELSPREAARRLTHRDYFEFWRSNKFDCGMPFQSVAHCASHLAEKLSREFFRRWALDPFMELTHHRLPILCCEMIVEELMNRDLYNICLAYEGQDS